MKKVTTVVLFLFLFAGVFAQSDGQKQGFQLEKMSFNASYYGETVWYPGFKVGAEYILSEKKKDKIKKSKKKGEFTKTKTNQFIITANLGYFRQPHNFGSLFLNSALLYRHTAHKGFQYNFGISPLGMNTFFFNETYDVSEDGTVKKAALPARIFYSPSLILGLGHTMKKKLTAWFLNVHLTSLIPYNNSVNFLAALEFGFRFNILKSQQKGK
jgi:hypothetical protein